LHKCFDWYYLLPLPPSPAQDDVVKNYVMSSQDDINRENNFSKGESYPKHYHITNKGHRRAFSCAAVVSAPRLISSSDVTTTGQLTPDSQFSQPVSPKDDMTPFHPSISRYSSVGSLVSKGEGFSGYDGSHSNSMTSLSVVSETHNVRQCYSVEEGGSVRLWLLIQVSDHAVKMLFHTRLVCTCVQL